MTVLYKCGLTIKTLDSTQNGIFTHFEHMDCAVISNDVNVKLCIVITVITNDIIITGDLNFHLDNVNDADAVRFNGTLEAYGLVQHVVGPTHKN